MWDTMIRIKEAKRALQDGRLEEAYRLASHPGVQEHRRARDIREKAMRDIYSRAVKHKEAHNLSQAYLDVNLVLTGGERSDKAVRLAGDIRKALEDRRELDQFHGDLLREARSLSDRGELVQVQRLLAPFQGESKAAEGLLKQIEIRVKECQESLSRATKHVNKGDLERGRELLDTARRLHAGAPEIGELEQQIHGREAESRVEKAMALHQEGDLDAAWEELRYAEAWSPTIRDGKGYRKVRDAVRKQHVERLHNDLEEGRFEAARGSADRLVEFLDDIPELTEWMQSLSNLTRAQELRARGEHGLATQLVSRGAKSKPLAKVSDRLLKEIKKEEEAVLSACALANKHVVEGDLRKALGELQSVLAKHPRHQDLRDQLQRIETQLRKGSEVLQSANEALNRSDIYQARKICCDLVTRPGFSAQGEELLARVKNTLEEVNLKMIRAEVALQGADSKRGDLEEALIGVQAGLEVVRDHASGPELVVRLKDAMESLIEAERGDSHKRMDDQDGALSCFARAAQLWPSNATLALQHASLAGRMGAQKLVESERLLQRGETSQASDLVKEALALLPSQSADKRRAGALNVSIEQASLEGEALLTAARDRAARGQYDEAESALRDLERVCPGHRDAKRMGEIISQGREAEAVTGGENRKDRAKEIEKLLLATARSREERDLVDNIRGRLARKRDFGGNDFLLRVEDGGEYLVLTGDSIRVGNVLESDVELPIMANISRVHARFERTRDFHHGERYRLVAEGGSRCFVNGKIIRQADLKHGDRIKLGSDLEMVFELPTEKSVSALLQLQGDFNVDGVDKIILMKPTGADGKILISSGKKSHVGVKTLSRDVEIYRRVDGPTAGGLVCTSLLGVEVDGRGGRAEENIHEGCEVRCGDLRFSVGARA